MGRKDQKPLVRSPPPANTSSSDGSDAVTANSSDHDTASSSSDEGTTAALTSPSSKKPISTPVKTTPAPPQPDHSDEHASGDDEDEEEEVDDDEESPPPAPKPESKPKPKEPESKPKPKAKTDVTVAALPFSSSAKRPAEKNISETNHPEKKAKKEKPSSGPTPQKFQRVWSDEDEVILVKGLIEFRDKKGVDPMLNPDEFFEFIKRSVHVPGVKKEQLMRKVRGIRQKFLKRKKPPVNPKELEAYDLGNKIWGSCKEETVSVAVKVSKSNPVKANGKVEDGDLNDDDDEEMEVEEEEEKVKKVFKIGKSEDLDEGLIDVESVFSEPNGAVVKRVMEKVEGAQSEEMRTKVKKANVASLEAYVSRLEVLTFAAKKMLDDLRNN